MFNIKGHMKTNELKWIEFTEYKDFSESYTLSKFNFTSSNECKTPVTVEFNDNYDNRIVCAFIFEHYSYLAVIFLHSGSLDYKMRLRDLETLAQEKEVY